MPVNQISIRDIHQPNNAPSIMRKVSRVDIILTTPAAPATPVFVDIKPHACPNPINVKSSGNLPVAILGTVDFDATTIDPVSIRLEGVAAIRSALDDVATPFEPPLNGEVNASNCTDQGPDGFMDLTLKFPTKEVVGALGKVSDGEVLNLTLTGILQDGTSIQGGDMVVILRKVRSSTSRSPCALEFVTEDSD
jgi:hypothetical protein